MRRAYHCFLVCDLSSGSILKARHGVLVPKTWDISEIKIKLKLAIKFSFKQRNRKWVRHQKRYAKENNFSRRSEKEFKKRVG